MYAVSHTLSHRGPSASRARARWQPYAATQLSTTAIAHRIPPSTYLNTPASSVSSSPPPTLYLNPQHDIDRAKGPSLVQQALAGSSREAQKARYVTRLVDQAVKSLGDIWQPEDIPQVFNVPVRAPCATDSASTSRDSRPAPACNSLFSARNIQLPSPVSPGTHSSPFPPPVESAPVSNRNGSDSMQATGLIPIKGFVHEVLRRSRTSTGVLQTALCYLEAVRTKIPELIRNENAKAAEGDSRLDNAAVFEDAQAMYAEVIQEAGAAQKNSREHGAEDSFTSIATPHASHAHCLQSESSASCVTVPSDSLDANTLPPLPPLPSPLLCPRRTFLACLILASKFMQDRSYSNRAWAKLAGLPAREIGRCERALGEALGWRLWVGKGVDLSGRNRTVARTRSENDVLARAPVTPVATPHMDAAFAPPDALVARQAPARSSAALRRHATVPALPVSSASTESTDAFEPFFREWEAAPYCAPQEPEPAQPMEISPALSTPTLVDSPMSSDGSGERTVQMGAFADVATPSPLSFRGGPAARIWDQAGYAASNVSVGLEAHLSFPDGVLGLGDADLKLAALDPGRRVCALPPLSELHPTLDSMYTYWTV